ncbi:MAG: DNA-3-methyladenine glycosylase 2 family protein [Micrococcales bacterium]|nr:DNA-3-methyladenine glycosylase 2 family protein [Micrococcales bacterium]
MSTRSGCADEPLRTRYVPTRELDLRQTVGALGQFGADPTSRRDGSGCWLTLRTSSGAATLHLRRVGAEVHAAAWGPGRERAIARVPGLCGADDDDTDFDAGRHPLVKELHHRAPGLRLARTSLVLAALLQAVFFQKVTGMEASRSWSRLVRAHGETAPGPAPAGMAVLPSTEAWRRIPSWEYHRAGVTPQRRDTLARVLQVAEGLERAAADPPAGARRKLRTVPGVGVWTAAETVQRSHGDPDAVSFGDFHVAKTVGWALTGRRVDDDGMRELLEPWRGHRQRVVRLITAAGISYERHGAKLTIPDHRAR